MQSMYEHRKKMIKQECMDVGIVPGTIHFNLIGLGKETVDELQIFLSTVGIDSEIEYEGMCG